MPYNFRNRSRFGRRNPRAPYARYSQKAAKGGFKQSIDPARFVRTAKAAEVVEYAPRYSFTDFDINELIKANLATKGYTAPSPIQDQTIPLAIEGRDIVGIANTGTGKTAAFAVPVINQLMLFPGSKALILAPTRELAQQIEAECRAIGKGSGLMGALLIGGAPMGPQLRDLRTNPRIIIGTPGRIKDHLERQTLDLAGFNIVVLDEVDRMLDMGFVNDMRLILGRLAEERQSFFFSATMDNKVNSLIDGFSNNPTTISVKTGETSDNVEQNVVRYSGKTEQIEKLHDLLNSTTVVKSLVFHETKHGAENLSKELEVRGFNVDTIHGGKTQGARQRALRRFKNNEVNVLVATDVAARGIDIADITHVINFSVPHTYDDYVHRIGRAGRAGRKGYALTFVESNQ
jgi:ATP-dependent RNA helicase RhlE